MGTVFNIQKFSVHDGPGIRTTVFLKGCPLRCLWCHNPEGLSRESEIEFEPVKCIACGFCAAACENECHAFTEEDGGVRHDYLREGCVRCGKCIGSCVAGALRTVGQEMTVGEVMSKVLADKIFYEKSGGGMTVSGGEPFFQPEFTLDLLKSAKEAGLHTAIETCGFCRTEVIERALPFVDLFLFDYKATGADVHKRLTGVDPALILANMRYISEHGGKIVLRCPIIPTANDTDEHFSTIASLACELDRIVSVELEPYHPLGTGKAPKLGREQSFITEAPSPERMAEIREYIASRTDKPVTVS